MKDEYIREELIQETFYAGLRSLKTLENRASEKTWLTSILKHKIIDYYRKLNSYNGSIEKSMISEEYYYETFRKELKVELILDENTLYEFENKELIKIILDTINKLPKQQAEVFTMSVIDEFETETICDKLNLTKNHVWVLLSKARKSLRNQFYQYQ